MWGPEETYTELGVRVLYTSLVIQRAGEVGNDGVSRPLREETEGQEDSQPVPVSLRLEEVDVAAVSLGFHLEPDGLLDLAVLELDGRVLVVAVGVVLGEHLERLVVLVLGHEESGRLGHPPDEDDLDDGR